MKIVRGYAVDTPLLVQGHTDLVAKVGDVVRLYLDQVADPALPAYIKATVEHPIVSKSNYTGTSYSFSYDEALLTGAITRLRHEDIVDVIVYSTQGRSVYESYLLTTNDLPPLSEAAWTDTVLRGPIGLTGATGPIGPTGPIGVAETTASATSFTPTVYLSALTVQSAIEQVSGATQYVPSGGIAATNVRGAINELDNEKAPKLQPTFTGTLTVTSNFDAGVFDATDGRAVYATSQTGIGGNFVSVDGTGVKSISEFGTHHVEFGDTGINRSFVARLKGAFGWVRGAFTGRIHPTDTLTADRTWTLPDASGVVALLNDPSFTGNVSTSGAISVSGTSSYIRTTGANGNISTAGSDASISTEGANASIATYGSDADIIAVGGGDIQTVSGRFTGAGTGLTGTAAGLTAGTVTTINGRITAGANVTLSGAGTAASPYSIAAAGGSTTWAALADKATAPLPTDNTPLANALALKAPLASPTFTGLITAGSIQAPTTSGIDIKNSAGTNLARIGFNSGGIALGLSSLASNPTAFASGDNSFATAASAHAEGGYSTASATFSHASGRQAKAAHSGARVISDSQAADVNSTAINECTFRFANGYRFLGGAAAFTGKFSALIPVYATDVAADTDATLLSGQLYKITGLRTVYQKP